MHNKAICLGHQRVPVGSRLLSENIDKVKLTSKLLNML